MQSPDRRVVVVEGGGVAAVAFAFATQSSMNSWRVLISASFGAFALQSARILSSLEVVVAGFAGVGAGVAGLVAAVAGFAAVVAGLAALPSARAGVARARRSNAERVIFIRIS
jgi:hypothetical protein